MKDCLRINATDSVAVALQPLQAGAAVVVDGRTLTLREPIPSGHKFALHDIAEGEDVIKYGDPIGHATRDIAAGELVDHNRIATNLEGKSAARAASPAPPASCEARAATPAATASAAPAAAPLLFPAYVRPDSQVGIRNDIWIVPTVGCVNGICRQIAERVRAELPPTPPSSAAERIEILHFPHNYGCSQLGEDHENTRAILKDMVLHPNAGGVLVVGLGCENNQPRDFQTLLGDYDKSRIRFLITQEVEGDEVEAGAAIVRELHAQARTFRRQPVPLAALRVGLKCGGSDGFSGITANPLLGAFSDWLCNQQGTTILTEVPEMFGAEHLLMRRAISDDVRQSIQQLIDDFKQYYISHGQPIGENPSPGNKAGGISTLEEKALGCTQKSGTSPVCGVLAYGEQLPRPRTLAAADSAPNHAPTQGLHLLQAPGNDLVASTALAAAGCQLVLFTTGRGTPFSTFVPTLKVSTNSELAARKPQWIDFDAGALLHDATMDDLLHKFIQCIIDVASGKRRTQAERHGNAEFAIFKTGVTL